MLRPAVRATSGRPGHGSRDIRFFSSRSCPDEAARNISLDLCVRFQIPQRATPEMAMVGHVLQRRDRWRVLLGRRARLEHAAGKAERKRGARHHVPWTDSDLHAVETDKGTANIAPLWIQPKCPAWRARNLAIKGMSPAITTAANAGRQRLQRG